ncbi:MAG: hypothetical protein K0S39_4951 [Paenibacillus sp.]|jgi:hypothetical protein|nr:hypothetical protein [Paenibacillus sp.]
MTSLDIIIPTAGLLITIASAIYTWNKLRPLSYVLICWFIIGFAISIAPFFSKSGSWSQGDGLGFLLFCTLPIIPVVGLLIAWKKSARFATFLSQTPVWVFVALQVYRIVGVSLIVLYVQKKLPFEIGFINGALDSLVAAGAVILGWLSYKKNRGSIRPLYVWNVVGLLDFVNAFTLFGLSYFSMINLTPAPTLMGMPPLTLLTMFQVPIAMFVHVYLFSRLQASLKTGIV